MEPQAQLFDNQAAALPEGDRVKELSELIARYRVAMYPSILALPLCP